MSDGGGVLARLSNEFATLVERALPGLTTVICHEGDGGGTGSGFVIDSGGDVVTNAHVVGGPDSRLSVTLHGARTFDATLVGVDSMTDLAMLKISVQDANPLPLRVANARLGEICMALGSPLGEYTESVSLGMVSGVGRSIPRPTKRPIEDVIQTDVAINPGNSGGPLIDMGGEVIGVNFCHRLDAAGIGFAIPSDTVIWVAEELKRHGSIRRAALGVAVAPRVCSDSGTPVTLLAVTKVKERAATPLAQGDYLLRIDGHEVRSRGQLFRMLGRDVIGSDLEVEVLRNKKVERLKVHAGELPS